jgi:hypothetical protein
MVSALIRLLNIKRIFNIDNITDFFVILIILNKLKNMAY